MHPPTFMQENDFDVIEDYIEISWDTVRLSQIAWVKPSVIQWLAGRTACEPQKYITGLKRHRDINFHQTLQEQPETA